MENNLIESARELHAESEEMEERVVFIDQQVNELTEMLNNLVLLGTKKSFEGISSLGKGLFIKSKFDSEEIFVDVGAGVVLAKKPKEIQAIISGQLEGLRSMRNEAMIRIAQLRKSLEDLIVRVESEKKRA